MSYLYRREAKKILYKLKHSYGTAIIFFKNTGETKNYDTGDFTYTTESEIVKRGILLPLDFSSKFSYDLTFLAANKNFQYGANYDTGMRYLIIDQRDITFDIGLQEYCTIDGKRYDVISFEDYAPSVAQIVRIRYTQNRE